MATLRIWELAMSLIKAENLLKARAPLCQHCNQPAKLVGGDAVYPHRPDLYHLNFWLCEPCQAFVGCHPVSKHLNGDGKTALGRPANAEVRKARSAVHRYFDPQHLEGYWSRREAYERLGQLMKLEPEDCHIGMFDLQQCTKALELVRKPSLWRI